MSANQLSRPLRYTLAVVLLVGLLSPVLSIFTAQRSAERSIRASEQAAVAQQEQGRRQYCDLLTALLNVYIDAPPQTDTGKAVQKEYLVQYDIHGCQPPRRK
jgi:hypothetical protein